MKIAELHKAHAKTLVMLAETERWESAYFLDLGWKPGIEELRALELELISTAEELTANIHDLKEIDEAEAHYRWYVKEGHGN